MAETTLTLKFRGTEANLLHEMVDSGLFNTKSEAVRAAIVNYSLTLGLLKRRDLWAKIQKFPRRNVSAQQLAKDLERIKNE
jgi:Arc/MetJ-type ribon-helix-helix transcriptional regulator